MVKTYGELFMLARKALSDEGVNSALYARLLLCSITGKTQAQLISDRDEPADSGDEEKMQLALHEMQQGKPLAYLLGNWSFYGMELTVTPDVLIPRDDTMAVTDLAIFHLRQMQSPQRVLDLCTGSGCIGLAIAKNVPSARVTLTDVSSAALAVAKLNSQNLKLHANCIPGDVRKTPPSFWGQFDLIVSNPPYVTKQEMLELEPSVRDYEPHLALDGGVDGLDFYRLIIRNYTGSIRPGGYLCLEFGMGQEKAVGGLLSDGGFEEIRFVRDLRGVIRAVSAKRK